MKNKSLILCLLATMTTACLMSSCKGKDSNEPYVGYLFAYFNGNAPWQDVPVVGVRVILPSTLSRRKL